MLETITGLLRDYTTARDSLVDTIESRQREEVVKMRGGYAMVTSLHAELHMELARVQGVIDILNHLLLHESEGVK